MSVVTAILIGLAMGFVFGFALEKSRVFEPGIIVGQMQMRNFIMLKIFLTAVATGLMVLTVLSLYGVKMHPKPTLAMADLVGGMLLGVGITVAGACPGTVLAQIGAGYKDAWITLVGGLLGAMTFSYAEPALKPVLMSASSGKLTLDGLLGAPFWLVAVPLALVLIVSLLALERWRPWRNELGERADGVTSEALPPTESAPDLAHTVHP